MGSFMFIGLVYILLLAIPSKAETPSLLLVIRSQPNSYHANRADNWQESMKKQISLLGIENIDIIQTHKTWSENSDRAWAILPILGDLAEKQAKEKDWVVFVEDGTLLKLDKMLHYLSIIDHKKDLLLARGLYDTDITIIHHFSQLKAKDGGPFLFPDFEAGWVLSGSLLKKIANKWSGKDAKIDFQIDLKHELAVFVLSLDVEVTNVPWFCGAGEEKESCITNVVKELPECGNEMDLDDVFVAVKTTLMFHKDRLKAVRETWGPKVKNLVMYSNVTDSSIPTIDCGVPNTVRGHCGKTDAILKDFLKRSQQREYKWLIVVDDDTIMSVARMVKLLNCYDPKEAILLGEKYGYSLNSEYGYGYITGGPGMVFSKPAVEAWVQDCSCPSIDTPDDMYVGQCLTYRSGIINTHSPLFHQARPDDYASGYLSNQIPVSFHKHWMVDPVKVYKAWFEEADAHLDTYVHTAPAAATPTPTPDVVPSPLPPTPTENQMKDEL